MAVNLHRIFLKIVLIPAFSCLTILKTIANTGDTLVVHGFNHFAHQNCNVGDSIYLFPPDSMSFYRIFLRYELSCLPSGCDIYDRIATLKVLIPTGQIDSSLAVAPSFSVNGNSPDSFAFMNSVSYSYDYNTITHHIDSSPLPLVMIYLFNDSLHPFFPTDTLLAWPSYYNHYIFDSSGVATDSIYVTPDSVLYLTKDSVYTQFEVRKSYEIARAITPYGEGVVLWFDVSDYRMLLHDSVNLYSVACGYSFGWKVTTDFYFIEGIPPMHPFKITNLWNGTFQYGDTANPIENHLQPITLFVDSQSVFEKIRLITTGHGFGGYPNQDVAEFYDVTHTLQINGTNFQQHLWRSDCGRNPLYPQGAPGYTSTWFYNRANWCPGSYVTPHDFNATPLVSPGDSLIVDYNMAPYTVTGGPSGFYYPEYYIQSQAFYYDHINYLNNASIEAIRKPNNAFEYNRLNPICQGFKPEVLIKNYGSDTLHQLTFHYGVDGSYNNIFTWTGNLFFTDTIAVELPNDSFGSGNHTFDIYIDQPNGFNDEFAFDDTMHSLFVATNIYNTNYVRIKVKTDNSPTQTSWVITDEQGNIVAFRNNFTAALATYTDTIVLSNGCYNFKINDTGAFSGDGICCYNGNGYLRFYAGSSPTMIVNNGDFGEYYSLNFSLDNNTGIDDPVSGNRIFIYPNPASDRLTLNTTFESAHLLIDILDVTGRNVSQTESYDVFGYSTQINLPQLTDGIYYLRIRKNTDVIMKKIIIIR